jgi:hypothetical protein
MEPLNGHAAGNGGHSQGASCTPPRRSPTRLVPMVLWSGARRTQVAWALQTAIPRADGKEGRQPITGLAV